MTTVAVGDRIIERVFSDAGFFIYISRYFLGRFVERAGLINVLMYFLCKNGAIEMDFFAVFMKSAEFECLERGLVNVCN